MTETKHVFGPNGHVADIKGSTKYYYHSDHLGSLKQETDDSGNALWSSPAQYDPFGEMRSGGPEKDGYFYTGKLRDNSTGLYYYGARYYDAKIGRFLTKDIISGSASNSQTMNLYIYTLNNPLKYIDPTGNWVGAYETYTTTKSGRVVGITGVGGYHDVSGQGLFLAEGGIVQISENSGPTVTPASDPSNGYNSGVKIGYKQYGDSTQFNETSKYKIVKKEKNGETFYDFYDSEGKQNAVNHATDIAAQMIKDATLDPKEQADFIKGFLDGLLKGAEDYDKGCYDTISSQNAGLPPPQINTTPVSISVILDCGCTFFGEMIFPGTGGLVCNVIKTIVGIFLGWL